MAVDVANTGEDAIEKADITPYDLVVLDRQLPDIYGDDICRQLVATVPAPRILMLTASGEIGDRVEGLGLGADDYLVKPFVMAELIARLQALARRPFQHIPPVLTIGDLRIDTTRRTVSRKGAPISLTRKEFGVLEMLATADGRVISTEDLLEHVRGRGRRSLHERRPHHRHDPPPQAGRATGRRDRRRRGLPAGCRTMKRLLRPTIRLRLTLVYGGLFLVAGAVLLTLMYVLLSQSLGPPPKPPEGGPPLPGQVQPADADPDQRTVEERI
jgi:DNA-binding response OmpR family regulator